MLSPNPFEKSKRARKVARLVSLLTAASPGVTPVQRLGAIARLPEIGWTLACLQIGSRPASEQTRHLVLVEFAGAAVLECAAAAHHRGEGGEFECLAIGMSRAALGLDYDAHRACQVAHDEMVVEAERIRGAA